MAKQNVEPLDERMVAEFLEQLQRESETTLRKRSKSDRVRAQMLEALAALGGDTTGTDDVFHMGTRFVIPETMNLRQAIRFLERKAEADDERTQFSRVYKYRPFDGAWCFTNAVKRHFGAMVQVPTKTFFGDQPPRLVTIPVGPDEEAQVPWGEVVLPHLADVTFTLDSTFDDEFGSVFVLGASGPNKFRAHINGVFALVQEELEQRSLYRGRAIDGHQSKPGFLDLSKIDQRVVYSEEVNTQLAVNVWSPIADADAHQAAGLAVKRAVLVEGPYGTGKSLAGALTGQVAQEAGWTFIMCRPGKDDPFQVMRTARAYEPAVIVIEDIDTHGGVDNNDNDLSVAKLLDAFDGIGAKDSRLVMLLTANHPERIHKGMLRPGRLDAVIHIGALDAQGIRRLIEVVVDQRLGDIADEDWQRVADAMADFMPAFVREAGERSVRYAIASGHAPSAKVGADDLINSAAGLRHQLDLMEGASERKEVPYLDQALRETIRDGIEELIAGTVDGVVDGAVLVKPNGDRMGVIHT